VTPEQEKNMEQNLEQVILRLNKHFGRLPTEQEVVSFVFGSKDMREYIYANKGLPGDSPQSLYDQNS
jgi:hypothetical protein